MRRASKELLYVSAIVVPAKNVEVSEIFSPQCALLPNGLSNFTHKLNDDLNRRYRINRAALSVDGISSQVQEGSAYIKPRATDLH